MDNDLSRPNTPQPPNHIARSVASLIQRTRQSLTPWTRHWAPIEAAAIRLPVAATSAGRLGPPFAGLRHIGFAGANTQSLANRVQRTVYQAAVLHDGLGSLGPTRVDRFAAQIADRFPPIASKYEPQTLGEGEQQPEMPLAEIPLASPDYGGPAWPPAFPAMAEPAPSRAVAQPPPQPVPPPSPPRPRILGQKVQRFSRIEEMPQRREAPKESDLPQTQALPTPSMSAAEASPLDLRRAISDDQPGSPDAAPAASEALEPIRSTFEPGQPTQAPQALPPTAQPWGEQAAEPEPAPPVKDTAPPVQPAPPGKPAVESPAAEPIRPAPPTVQRRTEPAEQAMPLREPPSGTAEPPQVQRATQTEKPASSQAVGLIRPAQPAPSTPPAPPEQPSAPPVQEAAPPPQPTPPGKPTVEPPGVKPIRPAPPPVQRRAEPAEQAMPVLQTPPTEEVGPVIEAGPSLDVEQPPSVLRQIDQAMPYRVQPSREERPAAEPPPTEAPAAPMGKRILARGASSVRLPISKPALLSARRGVQRRADAPESVRTGPAAPRANVLSAPAQPRPQLAAGPTIRRQAEAAAQAEDIFQPEPEQPLTPRVLDLPKYELPSVAQGDITPTPPVVQTAVLPQARVQASPEEGSAEAEREEGVIPGPREFPPGSAFSAPPSARPAMPLVEPVLQTESAGTSRSGGERETLVGALPLPPAPVSATPVQVQRQVDAQAGVAVGMTAYPVQVVRRAVSAEAPEAESSVDLDQLAEQILPYIKRLLEIERERIVSR